MEFKVKSLYLRISPRKVRPVLYGLRNMTAEEAKNALAFTNKKAAGLLFDIVKSGIAVAKENYFDANQVTVKSFTCNEGPRLKRMQPWSKGQARTITKRLCHLTLVLEAPEKEVQNKTKTDNIENKEEK